MYRDTAVSLIMQRLGKRTGLETDIIAELQQAQSDLELGEFLPWFLAKALSLTTIASVRAVALPSDFLRETSHKWWITVSSTAKQMYKGEYDDLYSRELFDSSYLESNYYAIVGSNLYQFPVEDSACAISGFYFGADTILSTNVTNQWLTYAPGLLIALAGMRMSKTLRDSDAYGMFKEDRAEAYNKLIAADVARSQAALNAVMGG